MSDEKDRLDKMDKTEVLDDAKDEGDNSEPDVAQGMSRLELNQIAQRVTGGHKGAGIIIAICMIILGIFLFIDPLYTAVGIAYIVTVAFIIYGIFQIAAYCRTPKDVRNGWTLANGIIYLLLGAMILADSFGVTGRADMLETFAFIIGFFALFGGITQCSAYAAFRANEEPGAGWVLFSGIINILLGIFIIMSPFAGLWAINVVFGIYLVIGGVALFAESASGKLAHKG